MQLQEVAIPQDVHRGEVRYCKAIQNQQEFGSVSDADIVSLNDLHGTWNDAVLMCLSMVQLTVLGLYAKLPCYSAHQCKGGDPPEVLDHEQWPRHHPQLGARAANRS